MQRTVNGTKITVVTTTNNGDITTITHKIPQTDIKLVKRELNNIYGRNNYIVKSKSPYSIMYVLDDEIFFKYAVPVDTTND